MKSFFTLVLILFSTQIQAQVITYSNYAKSLTASMNVLLANPASFNTALYSQTGNGITWNASSISQQAGTPAIHMVYTSPSSTPNGSLYTMANYSQYDPALTAVVPYNYYNISADSVTKCGTYEANTSHEIFQDPDKRLIFPFSYGQSFVDSYNKTNYSNSTTISSYQTGNRTVQFNGFGTLILPQATFSNVALISELRTNSLGPNSTTFSWFDISNGKQLMYYAENSGSTTIFFTSDLPSGIVQNENSDEIRVFPNPFTDKAILQFAGVSKLNTPILELIDSKGKVVEKIIPESSSVTLHKNDLKAGIYFYRLSDGTHIIRQGKLTIQ